MDKGGLAGVAIYLAERGFGAFAINYRLIGQTLEFKVIKFNKKRGNIVLSRRVLLEQERDELKNTLTQLGSKEVPGLRQWQRRKVPKVSLYSSAALIPSVIAAARCSYSSARSLKRFCC